ncbi:putative pyridoxamine 5'-phosphate oxidase family protein [Bacteroides zoogleoformans]|uniref:Pyridoxamine 5-phosphate oxidase n=1 Tax=Bacteroides zoogleoformans TaxID=28119 RepID=A0ABN5IGM4_9BACE|nr:pyridoxamine 5'-phosphate oxidase family protein [Bacteroides zoogleoformans]AVM51804.1 pyridoxamine 5-phosphate oxidase [Bacteroides zoogleoformans]TWJ13248.1 putative pyridoxamine 5'-phosphate oxidase family protein [Bacteroides zoogleoformans]
MEQNTIQTENGKRSRDYAAALDFLSKHKEVAFATCEDNRPKIRVFQIMRQEATRLYFATSAQKAVYQQLKRNPHIEILAQKEQLSVRCTGKADFNVNNECKQWIYNNNPVLPRLYSSYDKLAYFSLDIEDMDYYDLRPTPPILRHFNLLEGTETGGFVGERFAQKG